MLLNFTKEKDVDVILAKKGDGEAFGRLINKHKISMYRIAKNILRNETDIEDAVAEAILKAYVNINTLKKNENFKSWLIRILINQCNDILRKRKREIAWDELEAAAGTYEDSYKDFELMREINNLEEEQRNVTLLFYYEDMSISDIANILGIPQGTVKSRLARAKKKLEKLIKE